MAIHDAYARLTPYELLFPEAEFPDQRFPAIGDEAVERGADAGNPAAFVMLGAVQGILADLREEGGDPEAAHDHGGVLYFAYQMWRMGAGVVLARQKTLRALLGESADVPNAAGKSLWEKVLGGRAGYIQLPQHLVWFEGTRNTAPESVDGVFWYGDHLGTIHLALVAGMRSDRPGYLFVPVPPQPLGSLPGWASGPAREGGRDFETSLPGADLDELLGIRTPAEVFKLSALLLGRLALEDPAPGPPPAPPAQSPPPTNLPWTTL
ncbi:MAG: hypothetical protein OXI71_05010 [Gemmatimonadota bacterium]|nr:hypothetical protein [Gemmatimonadota bacterium]